MPYVRARRRGRSVARVAVALAIVAGIAAADEYPTHPIRLLVGFSADISCRPWAQRLPARIGQQVVKMSIACSPAKWQPGVALSAQWI